jgi:protein TonB
MEITPRHWLIALLIAGLAHAALAYALVHATAPIPPTAGGLMLELGSGGPTPALGAGDARAGGTLQPVPSARRGAAPDPHSEVAALEPVAARPADITRTEDSTGAANAAAPGPTPLGTSTPAETLVAKAHRPPQPQAPPAQAPPAAAEPAPRRAPIQREPRAEPRPKPRSLPTRAAPDPSEAPAQASSGQRLAKARPEPLAPRTSRSPTSNAAPSGGTAAETSAKPGQGGGRRDGHTAGRGNDAGGAGGSGGDASAKNYYGRLATWLARHKRYPAQARRLGQEGTVKVTFTISQSGRVLSKRITQSGGHALLDREVEAMLERASPLPRIPSSLGRSSLTITLPVAFALR